MRSQVYYPIAFLGMITGCQTNRPIPEQAPLTFVQACAEGRLDLVKAWVNPPLNESDQVGTTPLGYAVLQGDRAMAAFLLEKGADPHSLLTTDCIVSRSALAEAYRKNDARMVALLKRYGADLNHRGTDGETELHRSPLFSCDVVERLLKAGLDATAVDNEGRTVFFCFPSTNQMDCAEMETFVRLFQQYGADINRPLPKGGPTPYEDALEEGDFIKARIFRENGAQTIARATAWSHPVYPTDLTIRKRIRKHKEES